MTETFELSGDPDAIIGSAQHWTNFGSSAHSASSDVGSLDASQFSGDEADTYRGRINKDMTPHLTTAGDAWSDVGSALRTYAGTLRDLQQRMTALKAAAAEQKSKVDSSAQAVQQAQQADKTNSLATTPDPRYKSPTADANTGHADAISAFNGSVSEAAAIRKEHREAIQKCCGTIDDAKHKRFQKPPGFWDKLGAVVVHQFKQALAFAVKYVSPMLKMVSMVAGVLALIPFLTPVMGPIALAAGATALAIDVLNKLVTGQGSWAQMGLDALGLVPGVKQLSTFGKMAKLGNAAKNIEKASDGVKGAKAALVAAKSAKPKLAFLTRNGRAAKAAIKNAKTGVSEAKGALKTANSQYKALDDHFAKVAKNWRRVEAGTSTATAGLTGYRNYELNGSIMEAMLAGAVSATGVKVPGVSKKFDAIQNIIANGAATTHQAVNIYVLHPELAGNRLQQARLITGGGKTLLHSSNASMYSQAGTHPNGMSRAAFEVPAR